MKLSCIFGGTDKSLWSCIVIHKIHKIGPPLLEMTMRQQRACFLLVSVVLLGISPGLTIFSSSTSLLEAFPSFHKISFSVFNKFLMAFRSGDEGNLSKCGMPCRWIQLLVTLDQWLGPMSSWNNHRQSPYCCRAVESTFF